MWARVLVLAMLTSMGLACFDESEAVRASSVRIETDLYDSFLLKGVSLIESQDGRSTVNIWADKIVDRKRTTAHGLITYENLKELHVLGAKIEVSLGHGDSILSRLRQSLTMLGALIHPSPLEDLDVNLVDTDASILTRIRFTDLLITVHLPDQRTLSIEANTARLNLIPSAFVFRQPLTVLLDNGRKLEASRAVWSEEHGGIFFPEGYAMNGVPGPRQGVLTISTRGFFLTRASTPLPSFKIQDLIEARENALLGPLLSRIPKALLPFVLMFQPQRSNEGTQMGNRSTLSKTSGVPVSD